jgi:hypothetical protein
MGGVLGLDLESPIVFENWENGFAKVIGCQRAPEGGSTAPIGGWRHEEQRTCRPASDRLAPAQLNGPTRDKIKFI